MGVRSWVVTIATAAVLAPLTGLPVVPVAPASSTVVAATPESSTVPLSHCFPPDNGNPQLKSFSITPSTVTARRSHQVVTFTANPEDIGGPGAASGVTAGQIRTYRTPAASGVAYGAWGLKWNGHGGLVLKLNYSPHDAAGTWYVEVRLWDAAGNFTVYRPSDLAAAGMPRAYTAVTAAAPDHERPTVASVRLSTTTVDASRHRGLVRVRVRARDDSGVYSVKAFTYGSLYRSRGGRLHLSRGTVTDGQWAGRIVVPRVAGNYTGALTVAVRDYRGRSHTYRPATLAALGSPSRVQVIGEADTQRPRLRTPTISTSVVDLRTGAQKVTVRARITDRGAGVREVFMSFDGSATKMDHQGYEVAMERASGTANDGIWRGTVTLPPCRTEAGVWRGDVYAFDDGLPGRSVTTPRVRVVNSDIAPPSAEVHEPVPPAGPATVTFNEDVAGVTAENISVVDEDEVARIDLPGSGPETIAGSWACRSAAGSPVDCDLGPVRTALFTPVAPLRSGRGYWLVLNPVGHLGLTDLAGNPPIDLFDGTVFLFNSYDFTAR